MVSLKHFFVLSLAFHFLGIGLFGLPLDSRHITLSSNGPISVSLFSDSLAKPQNIEIKKTSVSKNRDNLYKKLKKQHLVKKRSFLNKKTENEKEVLLKTYNHGDIFFPQKEKHAEKTLFTQDNSLQAPENFPLVETISSHHSEIEEEPIAGSSMGLTASLVKGGETAGPAEGGLNDERSELLGIIRDMIEKSKRYPLLARRRGIEGTTLVRFRLKTDGSLERIELEKSSGKGILDRESINTVERAAPFPYVKGWLVIPLNYELSEKK